MILKGQTMKTMHLKSRPCYQKGLAMVEATIVLPLLFLLALAAAEFGHMLEQYNALNKQQQDGARFLSERATFGSTGTINLDFSAPNGSAYQARNLIVYGNVAGTGTPVLNGLSTSNVAITTATSEYIRVEVTYSYTPVLGAVFLMFGYGNDLALNFPLRSSIVMRVLS